MTLWTSVKRGWNRWQDPWAWMALAAAFGWPVAAEFRYLTHLAITSGSIGRAIVYAALAALFALGMPAALYQRRDVDVHEETEMETMPPGKGE